MATLRACTLLSLKIETNQYFKSIPSSPSPALLLQRFKGDMSDTLSFFIPWHGTIKKLEVDFMIMRTMNG
jgi:hypothetical protein